MALPFIPEPLTAMRARLPKILEKAWDPRECLRSGIMPGEFRAFVFDFENGLRLIVSRDRLAADNSRLHASASLQGAQAAILQGIAGHVPAARPGAFVVASRGGTMLLYNRMAHCLRLLLQELPGRRRRERLSYFPSLVVEDIPHWLWPLPEEDVLDYQI